MWKNNLQDFKYILYLREKEVVYIVYVLASKFAENIIKLPVC